MIFQNNLKYYQSLPTFHHSLILLAALIPPLPQFLSSQITILRKITFPAFNTWKSWLHFENPLFSGFSSCSTRKTPWSEFNVRAVCVFIKSSDTGPQRGISDHLWLWWWFSALLIPHYSHCSAKYIFLWISICYNLNSRKETLQWNKKVFS